jgi:hypothetical protein
LELHVVADEIDVFPSERRESAGDGLGWIVEVELGRLGGSETVSGNPKSLKNSETLEKSVLLRNFSCTR